jgi:hypothetical protein
MLSKIFKRTFIASFLAYSTLASSQTFNLVCIGSKTVNASNGQIFSVENFKQTYVFQDGKIGGNAPQKVNENTLSYNLSQKEDRKCKNFCDHNVILNSLTRDVLDTNYSIENGIKKYWEFKGLCSIN